MNDENRGVDNSYRVSDEERSIYRMMGYFFLAFVVYSVARHVIPQPFGTGIGVFLWTFGSWFAGDRAKREKISLARWTLLCLATSVVVAALVRWIEQL